MAEKPKSWAHASLMNKHPITTKKHIFFGQSELFLMMRRKEALFMKRAE